MDMYNQLVKYPSNTSLSSNSTILSEYSVHNENKEVICHENNESFEFSEPTTSELAVVSSSLTFDILEANDSKDINIGNKYYCASVNVYETLQIKNLETGKKQSIITCLAIISVLCILIAAYVAYYFYVIQPIKPSTNYTLHANPYLLKRGLKKENFNGTIQEIYLDDFLDFSSDENCKKNNQVNNF